MDTVFVKAVFDLICDWEGLPPIYRVFFNGELFVEREWRWSDSYLQEILQIQAPVGIHTISIQTVGPTLAHFRTANHAVEYGPGHWIDANTLEIRNV